MMLRIILGIVLSALIACGAQAQTGSPKPKPSLAAEIANCFPDNVVGAITPAVMRQCTLDFLASWQQYLGVNTQGGNSYTVQLSDYGQMVLTTANGPVSITLPAAGTAGFTPFNFWISVRGLGAVTITPVTGTINGAANLVLATNEYSLIVSDGTNWQTVSITTGAAITVNGGPAGALGYYATIGTAISPLTQCNDGAFATDGTGTAQCVTVLPPALTFPSPVFTGTVTGPDLGTWDATGINTPNGTFANLAFTTMSAASLGGSPTTITGLTSNNSPDAANDYMAYFSAADGAIRKGTVGSLGTAGVAGVSALNGFTGGLNIVGGDGMSISSLSPNITLNTTPSMPGGRLTLASGTPVMTTSVINAGSIFYDCFHGANKVPVWNGTFDVELPIGGCEISTAMTAGAGASQILAANVFDVWAISVTGTLTLCIATNGAGGGWASDTAGSNTARGTGYSQLDTTTRPYITNKNALAHCYNGVTDRGSVAANKATYLGTFYAVNNGQTSFQFGTAADVPGLFGIWNAYNRVSVASMTGLATVANWSYAVINVWRQAAGVTNVQTQYVYGLNEDIVTAQEQTLASTDATGTSACIVGVGVDATNVTRGVTGFKFAVNSTISITGRYAGNPGVGFHTLAGLEFVQGAGHCTFFGAAPGVANYTELVTTLMM